MASSLGIHERRIGYPKRPRREEYGPGGGGASNRHSMRGQHDERLDGLLRNLVRAVELDVAHRSIGRCKHLRERTRLLHRAIRIASPVRKQEPQIAVRQLTAI